MARTLDALSVGQNIGGYKVGRREPLTHLHAVYYELDHEATGARHIHIAAEDDNNVFCVAFPTLPKDATGVAHILEHTVLRGSERFPVRDPQTGMRARSLNTFLNAMTSTDSTMYPFSTRVEKDFFNLLQHYLGAAFFPLLEETAFQQEGHRLEFATTDSPDSELQYKGVVFNEMKGAMASVPSVMFRTMARALFPGATYSNNSGGDPAEIPNLTWEGLRNFHATHYHPSNAHFFTYGDLPLSKTLEEIESQALSRFSKADLTLDYQVGADFDRPREHREVYPLDPKEPLDKKTQVLVAWKTVPSQDSYQVFALRVLSETLLGNAASPLRKALIDSGLGEALADGTGVSTAFTHASFGAGLKNIDVSQASNVGSIVVETLESLAKSGIDGDLIEAAIHQFEIVEREISNHGAPFGLQLFFRLDSAYLYGGDPFKALAFESDLERLNSDISAGGFFESLIRQLFVDNPHRVTVVLTPDHQIGSKRAKDERERLDSIRSGLSNEDVAGVVTAAAALRERQDRKEDLSVLPSLGMNDIPMSFEDLKHTVSDSGGARVGKFGLATNGFSYVDLRAPFERLPEHLVDLVPLFAYALPRSGAGEDDYLSLARRIEAKTGGIHSFAGVRDTAGGGFVRGLRLSGKALSRNNAGFVSILSDLMLTPRFEVRRLKELIAEYKAQKESFVTMAGHQYSWLLASSRLGVSEWLSERLNGLSQLANLKRLAALGEDLDEVISSLQEISTQLFVRGALDICLTSDDEPLDGLSTLIESAVASLPSIADGEAAEPAFGRSPHQARTTSVPVAYNAKTIRVVDSTHEDGPALHVLSSLLGSKFLLKEVRQKGGAYGAYCVYDGEGGVLAFLSYRDPNIVKTFEKFEEAKNFPSSDSVEKEWIGEAILEACRAVDPLTSPDTKGSIRFFDDIAGYDLEHKARFKRGLLKVTRDDLVRVAQEYLSAGEPSMAIISNPEKVDEANAAMGGIFEVSAI